MICPECKREVDNLLSGVKRGKYVSERCERCMNNFTAVSPLARKYERDRQREDYRKDILQRWDGDKPDSQFVDAYPEQAKQQWGEDVVRDYGRKNKLL